MLGLLKLSNNTIITITKYCRQFCDIMCAVDKMWYVAAYAVLFWCIWCASQRWKH